MRSLLDPLNVALDAETQAICDEVCEALEWYDPAIPGSTEMARALGDVQSQLEHIDTHFQAPEPTPVSREMNG